MFWTYKKSFDVDVKKLGDFFQKNLVTLPLTQLSYTAWTGITG
jgi:hypothetical protein